MIVRVLRSSSRVDIHNAAASTSSTGDGSANHDASGVAPSSSSSFGSASAHAIGSPAGVHTR
ncbi:hypothetical protein, partial [Longimycelium tulufanense]|uniref:hypothetical protein n=1 Tax=Longimycelium tulufanense TaxID=907463 RepID=UPI001E4FED40